MNSTIFKYYLLSKYLVTTPEPGARLVLTHGLTCKYSRKINQDSKNYNHVMHEKMGKKEKCNHVMRENVS